MSSHSKDKQKIKEALKAETSLVEFKPNIYTTK